MSKKKKPKKKKQEPVVYDEWDFYPHYKDANERYLDRLGWMVEACESVAFTTDDIEEEHPIFLMSRIGNPHRHPYLTFFCYFTKDKRFGLLKEVQGA